MTDAKEETRARIARLVGEDRAILDALAPGDTREDAECEVCARLRKLTREGKARTYGISLSGGLQLPLDEAEREAWEQELSDVLHTFTGGWTISELPDDEQAQYDVTG